jgi:hypothetical protein
MKTQQKIALTVFFVGMSAFFYFGKEMLTNHTAWTDFQTPAGVGEIFGLFFSVVVAIGGALGVNVFDIIRKITGNQTDRRSDEEE